MEGEISQIFQEVRYGGARGSEFNFCIVHYVPRFVASLYVLSELHPTHLTTRKKRAIKYITQLFKPFISMVR